MPGFHIENFGCRAARADGEAVAERLHAAGQHCMQQLFEAEVVIVNTCSVTAEADRAARAYIRRAHRLNPEARIVVTGCYAQRAPEELAKLDGVAAVVGNSHKALVPEIASRLLDGNFFDSERLPYPPRFGAAPGANSGERPSFVTGHDFSRAEDASTKEERALATEGALLSVRSLLHGGTPIFVDDRFAHSFLEEAQVVPGAQTRPNLKIQEGCANRCTFCVIPFTRGPSRSLAPDAVLQQVHGFVIAGGNELVLSGINLGRWGRDISSELCRVSKPSAEAPTASRPTLAGLVRRIFRETELPRLRLSSIEPMDWDVEMIGLMAEFGGSRLCRHAHLPLQSGSDAVLRRMHRRYRPWHYAEKVAALFGAAGRELTLGADVMVGFPGETDAEFEETIEFVRALPFGYLHLFPFSPRPGTALHAAELLCAEVVEERMAALRALAAEKTRAHREQFLGRELGAITLHTPAGVIARGWTNGLTENFLPVEIAARLPANQMVRVRGTGLNVELALEAMAVQAKDPEYAAMASPVRLKPVPFQRNSSPISLAGARVVE